MLIKVAEDESVILIDCLFKKFKIIANPTKIDTNYIGKAHDRYFL